MIKTLGILLMACCLAGGFALAQSSEPRIHAPEPAAPPVAESPEAPPAPEPVSRAVPGTPAPSVPARPERPEPPESPDRPEPPEAFPVPAVVELPGDWIEVRAPGVRV